MSTVLEQALEEIGNSKRKGSKSAAWNCAEYAAQLASVEVHYDPDRPNWPDLARLEKDVRVRAALGTDTVIVTRHAGLAEWLKLHGITGNVIAQATPADVRGKRVVGALPLSLAAEAAEVIGIDMPGLKPEQRGKDLTPAEMDAAGATMSTYQVLRK
jgi:putative CRISPR-associated protein (TIGR02620 family)